MNILLTELSRPVWENLDLGLVYKPYCVRSVLTTSVKINPYRPPARLIRAKSKSSSQTLQKYKEAVRLLTIYNGIDSECVTNQSTGLVIEH